MRYLHKYYHDLNTSDFEALYQDRLSSDVSVRLGLHIRPMNQARHYELYLVPTLKMISLTSRIYRTSAQFENVFRGLPPIAQRQFINECIAEELFHTNDLEGIKSNKEELIRSTRDIFLNKNTKKRFDSMIKSYFSLLNQDVDFPRSASNYRAIYDDITKGEIEADELPDGRWFRKEITYILKKSGTGKVVHQGMTPESAIIEAMERLSEFMGNEEDGVESLIKVAVGHYFFGYVHPFYDGNGRTSRFISSLYLSRSIGTIPALSLSRGCNKYRNNYLNSFEITNSLRNCGEMNLFIEVFLGIISDTLESMLNELKEKSQLLKLASDKLAADDRLSVQDRKDIMFILAQNHFFDANSGLTVQELASICEKSEVTIRKIMKELVGLSVVDSRGERPIYYLIHKPYLESLES
ncbi:Fic family protein [Cohnella fermenti]|uniref:Fic family protein n=1 Tax=Cohnella fermenti TaxID=2565925 RepID=A0A4V6RXH8_9BACL|nr:Fic family protein [Cohnella fermenti]THF76225.1 Fic family protein [Cohnella fermenti]